MNLRLFYSIFLIGSISVLGLFQLKLLGYDYITLLLGFTLGMFYSLGVYEANICKSCREQK